MGPHKCLGLKSLDFCERYIEGLFRPSGIWLGNILQFIPTCEKMDRHWSFIFILSAILGPVNGDLECFVPGECLDSMMIGLSFVHNATECLKTCQKTRGCEWFTFYNDTKSCAALTGCLNRSTKHCQNCTSGEFQCPEFICGAQGLCLGAAEGVRLTRDLPSCHQICAESSKCKWFSFNNDTKVCTMTADCPALDKRCTPCIASEAFCELNDIREQWQATISAHNSSNGSPSNNSRLPKPENEWHVLFVVAGSDITGVELVDLRNETVDLTGSIGRTDCTKPANYPLAILGAAGGVVEGIPHVCGGDLTYGQDCYRYINARSQWEKYGHMPEKRANLSFAEVPGQGLWLSGGDSDVFDALQSNQTLLVNKDKVLQGPTLPYPEKYHCLTMVREGIHSKMTVVMSGGHAGPKTAWLFQWQSQKWIPLPDMKYGHSLAMCESIKTSRGVELIVAGGFDSSGQTQDRVEILSVETRTWRMGNPLPMPLAYGATVSQYETFMLIGGYVAEDNDSNQILQYDTGTQKWIIRRQKLKKPRSGHVAMWVKKKHLTCDSVDN